MPRRACRKDANHDAIADTFRVCGWGWIDTWEHAQYTPGFPDGIAAGPGGVVFVEIKGESGSLTDAEETFHWELRAQGFDVVVLESVDEALDFVGQGQRGA